MNNIHGISLFLKMWVYLAALGLSCHLGDWLLPRASLVDPGHVGSLFPDQRSNLHPLHCKVDPLTTGPPGKSLHVSLWPYTKYNCWCTLCVRLFASPWTVALQTPLSMGIRQARIWSGLPYPPPGDLPNQGIEPRSPTSQVDSLPSEPPGKVFIRETLYQGALY